MPFGKHSAYKFGKITKVTDNRLCFGIPRAEGRILETGIEEFFKIKTQSTHLALIENCAR